MAEDGFFFRNDHLNPYSIAVSFRKSGDMSFKASENEAHREEFFAKLHLNRKRSVRNIQVHSDRIVRAYEGMKEEADGIITGDASFAPYILTADCYNIFFTTSSGKEFGIVHAGWKGVASGITEALLRIMKGESKCVVAQGICKKHFTVGEDTAEIFSDRYGEKFIDRTESGEFNIDLRGIIDNILRKGSEVGHIEMCNVCMKESLYSYRLGNTDERNLSIIWRSDES